jgi:hypothetical protein
MTLQGASNRRGQDVEQKVGAVGELASLGFRAGVAPPVQ